jgi:hypothetical protein
MRLYVSAILENVVLICNHVSYKIVRRSVAFPGCGLHHELIFHVGWKWLVSSCVPFK